MNLQISPEWVPEQRHTQGSFLASRLLPLSSRALHWTGKPFWVALGLYQTFSYEKFMALEVSDFICETME